MKIAIIGPMYPWAGGIAKYLNSLSDMLDSTNITFTRQYPSLLQREDSHYSNHGQFEVGSIAGFFELQSNEKLADCKLDSLNPFNWYRLVKGLSSQKFDLVIFKYWNPYFAPCFGYIASKLRESGARICFVVDNVYPHEWFPCSKSLARYCLGNGDLFIVHSGRVYDELTKLLPCAFIKRLSHPVYDYGGIERPQTARPHLNLPDNKKLIMFFGYIRPYKGLDTLLHAFTITNSWIPDLMLLVAGKPFEKMNKYKKLAAALGIQDRVIWHTGYIPEDKVHLYFSAVDLLVLPYKEATQSGVVEIARKFNLPVIATDVGGISERIECVVQPDDFNELHGAMTRFFLDGVKCGYKEPAITFEDLAKVMMDFIQR